MSVMIGIDPHKGSHTAVVINPDEVVIDEIRVRASSTQVGELQEWASGYEERSWAVESARGLGYLLSQQLVAAGVRVVDVPAMMASRVRVLGSGKSQKNDPNDARSVAIAALRHPGLTPVVVPALRISQSRTQPQHYAQPGPPARAKLPRPTAPETTT